MSLKKICLVIWDRDKNEYYRKLVNKHANSFHFDIVNKVPDIDNNYDLINIINYQKKIENSHLYPNAVVMHCSDLPQGKGWSPLYYTIVNNHDYYCLTVIKLAEAIDSGNVICKARFKMKKTYCIDQLRLWDDILMLELSCKIVSKCDLSYSSGKQQEEFKQLNASFNAKPNFDYEICTTDSIQKNISELRARYGKAQPYIRIDNETFKLKLEPVNLYNDLPDDVSFEFYI